MSECGFVHEQHVVPTEVESGHWRPSLGYSPCEPPKQVLGTDLQASARAGCTTALSHISTLHSPFLLVGFRNMELETPVG